MPFPFEQLFASSKLRIISIPNLEPRTSLRIVGCPSVFRDDTLQVQLANFLEEGNSALFYVIGVMIGDSPLTADGSSWRGVSSGIYCDTAK